MVELFLELVPAKLGAKLAMVDYQDWESFRRATINEAKYLAVIEKEDNLLNIAFSRTNLYNNKQSSSDKPIPSSCFNCGGRGHHSNVCPSPRPSKGSKKGPSKHRNHHKIKIADTDGHDSQESDYFTDAESSAKARGNKPRSRLLFFVGGRLTKCMPDCGAEASIMDSKTASDLGLTISPCRIRVSGLGARPV